MTLPDETVHVQTVRVRGAYIYYVCALQFVSAWQILHLILQNMLYHLLITTDRCGGSDCDLRPPLGLPHFVLYLFVFVVVVVVVVVLVVVVLQYLRSVAKTHLCNLVTHLRARTRNS